MLEYAGAETLPLMTDIAHEVRVRVRVGVGVGVGVRVRVSLHNLRCVRVPRGAAEAVRDRVKKVVAVTPQQLAHLVRVRVSVRVMVGVRVRVRVRVRVPTPPRPQPASSQPRPRPPG